ncbi:MAG: hypothetical protein ACRC4M_01240 [Mycoplasma sp.]
MGIFSKKPPLTGGNEFILQEELKAQDMINKSTYSDIMSLKSAGDIIDKSGSEQYIQERTLEVYWLLQIQANYFTNTINYESNDIDIRDEIPKMIRLSFMNGIAGLYKDEALGRTYAVAISDIVNDAAGRPKKFKILPAHIALANRERPDEINDKQWMTIKGKEVDNVIPFKWGTMGIGAWVLMLPFIKQQQSLLTMMTVNSFVFIKKYVYEIQDLEVLPQELKNYYNYKNPFIFKLGIGKGKNLANRIEPLQMETGSKSQRDFIDYYKESVGIWYALFGRRVNEDFKRERNITAEVEASQESFDVIQKDYLNQFEIFTLKAQKLCIDIKVPEPKELEQEGEENDGENNVPATENK